MDFDRAFKMLIQHEGGFSNHSADPGGKTMFGITEAVARENGYTGDMRQLPLATAQQIYRRQYWDAVRAEELPASVRYAVFDAAVNSGPRQAIRWLQRAVGAKDDGIIGPQTLALVRSVNQEKLVRVVLAQRLRFMSTLPNWPAFSRGWARRIADLMEV
jgi:lysozyme family protein